MNIQEAKDQIKESVSVYLMKDKFGNYRIPIERQRPVFLLGAPGIGKTAIMEQIAQELGIALVAYSMTHHTRQSALGLPFIQHKSYQGTQFDVSEYTMSEIVASVYETIENSGKQEGILFLDEINCVSETLAPSMLQFLQYKTFGKHQIPKGWVVVTAGNPPEFNKSVREFDIVTLDRLKVMEVEPDYPIWRTYGINKALHSSILTYLDIKKADFYVIENTVDGMSYVTARGWEDLSETMYLYEEQQYKIDETLIGQYIRNKRIARDFASYYDLFTKYRKDYKVHQILEGEADREIKKRAKNAQFDERLSLIGLLLDAIQGEIRETVEHEEGMRRLLPVLQKVKVLCMEDSERTIDDILSEQIYLAKDALQKEDEANALSATDRRAYQLIISTLEKNMHALKMENIREKADAFTYIKKQFDEAVAQMQAAAAVINEKLHNLFVFVEKTFGDGNELLILVTELTVNYNSAKFISQKGCPDYYKYNKKFLLYERQQELMEEVEKLDL